MSCSIKSTTEYAIRDLHARESMRLGWYRHMQGDESFRNLRAQKAHHQAFLRDLMRRRDLSPFWYAQFFYWAGSMMGRCTSVLPQRWRRGIERTLETWILQRYERYHSMLQLHRNIRSMVEAVQLDKLSHNEPANDVMILIESYIRQQQILLLQYPLSANPQAVSPRDTP